MRALAREIGADQPLMGAGVASREPIAEGHWDADLLRQIKFDLKQHTMFGLPGAKAFTI